MKADLVHQLVHDEGGACHITSVLHDGKEEIKDEDIGKEYQYASYTGDYAVDQHILEPTVPHEIRHEIPEFPDQPVYPVHRIFSKGESRLEYDIQDQKEYREGSPFVGDHRINLLRPGLVAKRLDVPDISLGKDVVDELVSLLDLLGTLPDQNLVSRDRFSGGAVVGNFKHGVQ